MKCIHPTLISSGRKKQSIYVPCGRCAWCRKRKQDDWFFRLSFEARLWPFVFFVTLTYDDDHIPTEAVDKNGVCRYFRGYDFVRLDDDCVSNIVIEQDPQRYFKRLTKRINSLKVHQKFYQKPSGQFYLKPSLPGRKYICVPEYGSHTNRPHYHFILFTTTDVDCSLDWPFGDVVQVPGDLGSFRYVTKYLLKGGNNEFSRLMCSRGIGQDYINFDSEFKKFDVDSKVYLPRYLRDKWTALIDSQFLEHDIQCGLVSSDSKHSVAVSMYKEALMDKLVDCLPHSEFEKVYLQRYGTLDGFSQWMSDIYEMDNKKQYQINGKSKV